MLEVIVGLISRRRCGSGKRRAIVPPANRRGGRALTHRTYLSLDDAPASPDSSTFSAVQIFMYTVLDEVRFACDPKNKLEKFLMVWPGAPLKALELSG